MNRPTSSRTGSAGFQKLPAKLLLRTEKGRRDVPEIYSTGACDLVWNQPARTVVDVSGFRMLRGQHVAQGQYLYTPQGFRMEFQRKSLPRLLWLDVSRGSSRVDIRVNANRY